MSATSSIMVFGSNRYGNLGIDHLIAQSLDRLSLAADPSRFSSVLLWYNKKQQVLSVPTRLVPHMIQPDNDTSEWDRNMYMIDYVECGMYHSVFLASNIGRVYLCGDNSSCQCSYSCGNNDNSGRKWFVNSNDGQQQQEAKVAKAFGTPVPVREQDKIGRVKLIAAGANHTVLYTSTHMLYGFGCNAKGQIPTASTFLHNRMCNMSPIRYPNGETCVAMVCGASHSWFISNNGNFYCCGSNMDSQCLGSGAHYPVPFTRFTHDELPKNFIISKIACCSNSTILLGQDGSLFGFGQNNYGQLGLGYTSDKQPCIAIPNPSGKTNDPIVDIFCKYNSSAFVSKSGRVYMSGDSWSGQCGVKKDHIATPTLVQIDEPVIQVALALNYSFFRTVNRNVYACGDNTNGMMGIPPSSHQQQQQSQQAHLILTPTKVPIPQKQAMNVICGQYYTIILMGEFLGEKMHQLKSCGTYCDLDLIFTSCCSSDNDNNDDDNDDDDDDEEC